MINAQPSQASLQFSVLVLLAGACLAALFGMFLRPDNNSAFLGVVVVSIAGIIILAAPAQLKRVSVGLKGVEAELREVREVVDDQQSTIRKLVTFSLAEVIYRELLWKIGHSIEVKCDGSADQQRWLTLLFDNGMLTAKDWSQEWRPFDQIATGENLSAIFAPTPAAKDLMDLRGPPR